MVEEPNILQQVMSRLNASNMLVAVLKTVGPVEIPISDLITTPDFSSTQIRIARIFASVVYTTGGQQMASPIHYVELEGLRLENETTVNPVYAMSGYSVVRTTDGQPIYKYENTNNYIEFRFNLDVG